MSGSGKEAGNSHHQHSTSSAGKEGGSSHSHRHDAGGTEKEAGSSCCHWHSTSSAGKEAGSCRSHWASASGMGKEEPGSHRSRKTQPPRVNPDRGQPRTAASCGCPELRLTRQRGSARACSTGRAPGAAFKGYANL
ncbi:hypothetical protein TURU_045836 [Turdus rufiventris]|nr:hypothetical protein TURU_045836 [Turdus rufiventris]